MKVKAKCHNHAGCLRAFRGDEIELEAGAPLVCPECGQPLHVAQAERSRLQRAAPWGAAGAVVLIGSVVWLSKPLWQTEPVKKETVSSAEATPVTETAEAEPDSAPAHEPPAMVTAPETIDVDLGREENRKVKQEVLTRIDLMPNISDSNKDKLYNSVERARSMGKMLTVPFGSGKTQLGAAEIQALQDALQNPQLAKLRDDPTAVFVILGYADPKGDAKKNLSFSQTRAEAVMNAMRDKAGVMNVMHAVGMGGSTLLDSENLEKNRIAEVWVVLP